MTNSRFYSSVAQQTTLTGSADGSTTSINVASTAGFPASTPFTLALDYGASNEELVDVTNVAGLSLTVTRAVDGTSASSHNVGAVVRHVSSARDFTDSRTHEAASSGIHGVTGLVVGTTDSQTLTNKTLTTPNINGAALSGTFSGGHTYSGTVTFSGAANLSGGGSLTGTFTGAPVLSGGPNISAGGTLNGTFAGNPTLSGTVNHTGTIQSTQSASTNVSVGALVSADTFDRFRIYADGKHEWGSGAAGRDVNLYRSSADTLKTDDKVVIERASVGDDGLGVRVVGDGGDRFLVDTASTGAVVWWGTGSGAPDTNLYRDSNNTLKTDGGVKFGGTLTDTATTLPYKPQQSGTVTVSFSAQASNTVAVSFATSFAATPKVVISKSNGPGGSNKIIPSAISITTSGFTAFFTTGDGNTVTTTNLTSDWIATVA